MIWIKKWEGFYFRKGFYNLNFTEERCLYQKKKHFSPDKNSLDQAVSNFSKGSRKKVMFLVAGPLRGA